MNKKDKDLLIKDLSARVFYGVKVRIEGDYFYDEREPYDAILKSEVLGHFITDVYSVKPYLRPMSSMTDEEYDNLCNSCTWLWFKDDLRTVTHGDYKCYDWLNAHHFDYRGLIPMGLALEASEEMYKNN